MTIAGVSGQDPNSLSLVQFQIRALESQKRQQEIVLRRKTQEVRGGDVGLASPNPMGVPAPVLGSETSHPQTVPALGAGFPKGWGDFMAL